MSLNNTTEGSPILRCVASTKGAYCKSIDECFQDGTVPKRRKIGSPSAGSNCLHQAQFSGDGTTVITHSEDGCLRTFVLPTTLLDDSETILDLVSHDGYQTPSNILAYSIYPYFQLTDLSTTVVLSASRDLPLTLRNALNYDTVHASYPLQHPLTEAFVSPHSLEWTPSGTHFIAGSKDLISVFDASRYSEGPAYKHKTAPGQTERRRYGGNDLRTCKGIVSALNISQQNGTLAAGTFDRNVAIYESEGLGQCATAFSVAQDSKEHDATKGYGVTHLRWSPCGTYLLIAERRSNIIQIYDLRNTLGRVGWLSGRKADTTQKLGFEIVPTAGGYETWAGGADGCVRMWKGAGMTEGGQEPDQVMKLHDDPVSSAIWHPGGDVLATCSGRRSAIERNECDTSGDEGVVQKGGRALDNTLSVWSLE